MKKYFVMKNKSSIFAVFLSGTKILNLVCVVFFIATNTALYAVNIGDHSIGYCTSRSVIVPDRTEKGRLSSFITLIFHSMSGTMKSQGKANNSTLTLPSTGTKSVEISQLFHPEFIEFTKQLGVMREWLDTFRDEVARHDEQIHSHLIDAESSLYEVANNFSALLAIEFREKVYFKNL